MGKEKEIIQPIDNTVVVPTLQSGVLVEQGKIANNPTIIDHGFFTELVINKPNPKKEVIELEKIAKPEPVNEIQLGEITSHLLQEIVYPCILRARFYAKDINIDYKMHKDDDFKTALTNLREAIFCAQYGKQLPARCSISSSYAYNAGWAFALQGSISTQEDMPGICDMTLDVIPCEAD